MSGPLTRRRLLSSLDEDAASDWPPSQLARLEAAARDAERQRDRANVEVGRALLADYLGPGVTYRDAMRAYVDALLAGGGS